VICKEWDEMAVYKFHPLAMLSIFSLIPCAVYFPVLDYSESEEQREL